MLKWPEHNLCILFWNKWGNLASHPGETGNLSILDQEEESQFTTFYSLLIVLFMLLFQYILKSCIWIYSGPCPRLSFSDSEPSEYTIFCSLPCITPGLLRHVHGEPWQTYQLYFAQEAPWLEQCQMPMWLLKNLEMVLSCTSSCVSYLVSTGMWRNWNLDSNNVILSFFPCIALSFLSSLNFLLFWVLYGN